MARRLPKAQEPEAIRDLVRHMLAGEVVDGFAVAARNGQFFGSVFLPLLWGALNGYSEKQVDKLAVFGILGEDQTLKIAINGWPMFTECRIWRRSDWMKAVGLYEKARAAQERVLG